MTIAALTKPVDELTAEDIEALVANRIEEGEHVEFKAGFSSSGRPNQVTDRDDITKQDQTKLLKELVAFMNGYGGRLFLGVAERHGNPPVADKVNPVPNCKGNADKLLRAFGNLIDPPLVRLGMNAIETQSDGSGVIVFDVPRSIRAPHMSKRDNRSYRRRGSESVPMDMRDVQDMTLRLNSRQADIKAEFAERKQDFETNAEIFKLRKRNGILLQNYLCTIG